MGVRSRGFRLWKWLTVWLFASIGLWEGHGDVSAGLRNDDVSVLLGQLEEQLVSVNSLLKHLDLIDRDITDEVVTILPGLVVVV